MPICRMVRPVQGVQELQSRMSQTRTRQANSNDRAKVRYSHERIMQETSRQCRDTESIIISIAALHLE